MRRGFEVAGGGSYLLWVQETRRTEMDNAENRQTAQNLMSVHGLRAQAVVQERLAESRAKGDIAEMDRWAAVGAAIAELRRTAGEHREPGRR